MPGYDRIGFLTDYGLADGFVAACHGVVARIAPAVRVIDITHQIPPQNVRRGAAVLAQTVPWLPPAVHLAVVDPGVGTARRAIAVLAGQGDEESLLVGPDNGLLSWAWTALGGAREAVEIENAAYRLPTVSATFHGRDVFAPAAAHLASGVPLAALGSELATDGLVRLPQPTCVVGNGRIEAEIVSIDGFGNVQLAATRDHLRQAGWELGAGIMIEAGGTVRPATVGRTFADVAPGALVVIVDSAGHVAIAANRTSAAAVLSFGGGDTIALWTEP